MSYLDKIGLEDTLLTAFGRVRTAGEGQRLDVEFIYDKQIDFFDEVTRNGSVTHNANGRDLTLAVSTTTNGDGALMSSHPVPYTPGNGQLIEMTGVLDLANLEVPNNGTVECFVRSSVSGSVVETTTPQANWVAKTSGVDWDFSQIFVMSFQSLKVGTIDFALNSGGVLVPVCSINNDNVRDSGYWQQANGKCYYHIYHDLSYTYCEIGYGDEDNAIGFRMKFATKSASITMKAICATAKSEGGPALNDLEGLPRVIDNGTTSRTVAGSLLPLISIRAKSTYKTFSNLGIGLPKGYTIQANNPIRIAVVWGGTLTGASWNDVNTNNSMMEYDVAGTAISGGVEVSSEYMYATSTGPASRQFEAAANSLLSKTVLWDRAGSETGILSLCAIRTTLNSSTTFGGLKWDEIR